MHCNSRHVILASTYHSLCFCVLIKYLTIIALLDYDPNSSFSPPNVHTFRSSNHGPVLPSPPSLENWATCSTQARQRCTCRDGNLATQAQGQATAPLSGLASTRWAGIFKWLRHVYVDLDLYIMRDYGLSYVYIYVYCHVQSEDVAVKSLQCNIKFSDVCIKDLTNVRSIECGHVCTLLKFNVFVWYVYNYMCLLSYTPHREWIWNIQTSWNCWEWCKAPLPTWWCLTCRDEASRYTHCMGLCVTQMSSFVVYLIADFIAWCSKFSCHTL